MTTIATILSGGEGVGVGAQAAGLHHLWGIEIDDRIAQVARDNGFHMITADIQDIDPSTLKTPDILHASPECYNASSAKHDPDASTLEEKESPLDVQIAECIVRYLTILRPRVFTLENVYGYRRFEAFRLILHALNRLDYFTHFGNLNAADFGVPQTRRRLILRAVRGGLVPMLPLSEPWVGWYEAIEDLIPTLPESEFAPWQLARLPESIDDSAIFSNQESNDHKGGSYGVPFRRSKEPALTITGQSAGWHKAFLVDSAGYVDAGGRLPVQRDADEPANTVVANHARRPMRAFLMMTNATSSHPETRGTGLLASDQPANTVCAGVVRGRAFLVGGQFAKPDDGSGEVRPAQVRGEAEPVFTVTAKNKGDWRAWLSQGRVVKMTPRALARFQSFPDSYVLPDSNGLACKIIGNACPPLMYQKIVAALSSVCFAS